MRSTLSPLILLLASGMAAATPRSAASSVDGDISRLVQLFTDGIAQGPKEFRHVTYGHVYGTRREDAVALFTIEGFHGGNSHAEYLAFFEALEPERAGKRRTRPFRLAAVAQIGGRMSRTFEWTSARVGLHSVTIAGKRWGSDDAACCASIPISVTFRVQATSVTEDP